MYFQDSVLSVDQRGASSLHGINHMMSQLPALFDKHNITSIFDAGANDCAWQKFTLATIIKYSAGDHQPKMVDLARANGINAVVNDIRKDPFPAVDALFVRDVAIHLNNANKKLMIQNWLDSNIPWILITHTDIIFQALDVPFENKDFEHTDTEFPFAEVNWKLPPWNFPEPTDFVIDLYPTSRRHIALWHRDQICL